MKKKNMRRKRTRLTVINFLFFNFKKFDPNSLIPFSTPKQCTCLFSHSFFNVDALAASIIMERQPEVEEEGERGMFV